MFDLEKVSKRKLLFLNIIHWILYSAFCVVLPCITILHKYDMTGEKTIYISGIGICILIVFLFIGLKLVRREVNKISIDSYLWKSRLRAILSLILSVMIPVIVLFIVTLIKDNMELALSCIETCVWFIIAGLVEDCLLGSSLERENLLMDKAKADSEKEKRSHKI